MAFKVAGVSLNAIKHSDSHHNSIMPLSITMFSLKTSMIATLSIIIKTRTFAPVFSKTKLFNHSDIDLLQLH
jgi:hypothetical protein